MARSIIFKKIKFNNLKITNFNKYIVKKGLFVFPAAPALASIEKSYKYYDSIKKADFVFFDSGFFVLLLKVFKNINVNFKDAHMFNLQFYVISEYSRLRLIFIIIF